MIVIVNADNVPVIGDLQIDRYDRDDTAHLIAKTTPHGAHVLGSLRLLPAAALDACVRRGTGSAYQGR